MLVLASILIITTVVVEFAYNAHVAYDVAAAQRDQLKAYYLARSALNLIKLELRSERQLRQQFAGMLSQLAKTDLTSDPLCKTYPLSTGILQGLSSGLLTNATGSEADKTPEAPKQEEEKKAVSEEKSDPFDLGGDFEATCDTEERKINLNAFYRRPGASDSQPTPGATSSGYDEQKNLLVALFSQKAFEPIFNGHRDEILKVVGAIADWADADERTNEVPGISGGLEEEAYSGLGYKPKNGKYEDTSELLLVPGVGDQLYRLLEPSVTVFGDNKLNVCQADGDTLRAFLLNYSLTTPGASRLNPEDEPKMLSLVQSLKLVCQKANPQSIDVANAITSVLGGSAGTETPGSGSSTRNRSRRGQDASNPPPGAQGTGLVGKISTTNRFFSVEAVGEVGEQKVTIRAVLDAQSPAPTPWKTVYFQVR